MDLMQFLLVFGFGVAWKLLEPQIPFLLSVAGFAAAWWFVNYLFRLWGGRPRE